MVQYLLSFVNTTNTFLNSYACTCCLLSLAHFFTLEDHVWNSKVIISVMSLNNVQVIMRDMFLLACLLYHTNFNVQVIIIILYFICPQIHETQQICKA